MKALEGTIIKRGLGDKCLVSLRSGARIAAEVPNPRLGEKINIQWDYARARVAAVWRTGEDPRRLNLEWEPEVVYEAGGFVEEQ